MSTTTALPFPIEILTMIIEEAWKATTTSTERSIIYDVFAPVSSDLFKALVKTALRFVRMSLDQYDLDDLKMYAVLHAEAMRLAEEQTCADDFLRQLFHKTQFDLHINCRLEPQMEAVVFKTITSIVKDCKTFRLAQCVGCRLFRGRCASFVNLAPVVFQILLPSFPSLTHVTLEDTFNPISEESTLIGNPLSPPVSTILSLRVRGLQLKPRDMPKLPLVAGIVSSLRELHIAQPIALKCLIGFVPPTLERLTIEAPVAEHIKDRAAYSSILEYNIAAGLRHGLSLRGPARAGLQKIVVLTGKEEPIGWSSAKQACEEYGVELVHEVVSNH